MALGLRGCSVMAKAAPPQGAAARPPVRVRQYVPHQDHPAVADICRNVYGGKDWLPHLINEQAAEPRTQIVVAEDEQGRVDGLGELSTTMRYSFARTAIWAFSYEIARY